MELHVRENHNVVLPTNSVLLGLHDTLVYLDSRQLH